jgi:hypothetical protein
VGSNPTSRAKRARNLIVFDFVKGNGKVVVLGCFFVSELELFVG